MFFDKAIANLRSSDIRDFVELNREEGLRLDYKSNHPAQWLRFPQGKTEVKRDKQHKFLRHVAAFANSEGGTIFYGIEEENGLPTEITPITEQDPEDVKQHLSDLIRTSIEPPPKVSIEFVEFDDEEYVVVVDIPESFSAPHMVQKGNHTDFYQRQNGGSEYMNYEALRQRFARQTGLVDRIRNFRERRVERLDGNYEISETAPVDLDTERPPRYGLHVVPLPRFADSAGIDFDSLDSALSLLSPIYGGSADSRRFNLDGMTVYHRLLGSAWTQAYTLLFRNGALESFNIQFENSEERPTFSIGKIVREVVEGLTRFSAFYRQNDIAGPYAVFFSIANAGKATIKNKPRNEVTPDRSPLMLPEIVTSQIDDGEDCVEPLLTTLFHALHSDSLDEGLMANVEQLMENERDKLDL